MAFTTGMIHGSLRSMICRRGLIPNKVAPDSVKKYIGVSNFVGEKGSKQRLKGNEKKEVVKEAVFKLFNWTHPSHDVIDAYIIARIAWNVYLTREYLPIVDGSRNQIEVVKSILAGTEE